MTGGISSEPFATVPGGKAPANPALRPPPVDPPNGAGEHEDQEKQWLTSQMAE